MSRVLAPSLGLLLLVPLLGHSQEKVFSGPQVGEKLPPFKVRGVFDADAGKDLDFVKQAAGGPVLLVFVHEANRPSIGLTRTLTGYTAGRAKDGLVTGVVWLADDATEAEQALKRMRHGLAQGVPVGIAPEGKEGPGSYGLNRNVTLTVLVGKGGKVTANFALVQPSIQADLPKVLEAVAAAAGGPVPRIEDLPGVKEMMAKPRPTEADPKLPGLLRAVIRKNASKEDVEKAAAAVEDYVKRNEAARKEVGRIARTVAEGGKLADYGTPPAQEQLRKWAKQYGGDRGRKP
jgi:hypothetical protein